MSECSIQRKLAVAMILSGAFLILVGAGWAILVSLCP
jgi:hypothetical protein